MELTIALPVESLDDQLARIDTVQGIDADCGNTVGWNESDYLTTADWQK